MSAQDFAGAVTQLRDEIFRALRLDTFAHWLSRKLDPDRYQAFKTLEMAGWLDPDDDLPMTEGVERLVLAWGEAMREVGRAQK